jgi:ankyrin repeat protein
MAGGGNNNNHTVTALCLAAAVGDVECVRALLRAGANPSIPCFEHAFLITSGSSSSSSASSSTEQDTGGIRGNGNDNKMLTPAEFAQKRKHYTLVVALLEHQQQHKLPLTRLQPPLRPQKKKPSSS